MVPPGRRYAKSIRRPLYFIITATFSGDVGSNWTTSSKSATGVKQYNPSFPIYFNIETSPNYVFVRHEIRGGTSGSLDYLVYTQAPISIGQIYLFL